MNEEIKQKAREWVKEHGFIMYEPLIDYICKLYEKQDKTKKIDKDEVNEMINDIIVEIILSKEGK